MNYPLVMKAAISPEVMSLRSAIEKDTTLTKLLTDRWEDRNVAPYIRGLRVAGNDTKEITEELRFLETLCRNWR
jgi:hypothetical protein